MNTDIDALPHPTQQQGRDSDDDDLDLWFEEIMCDSPHGNCRDK